MKKISSKIILSVVATVFLVMSILGIASILIMNEINDSRLSQLEEKLYEEYDTQIQYEVETMISQLDGVVKLIDSGEFTEEEGKLMATSMIREARYGENGYF